MANPIMQLGLRISPELHKVLKGVALAQEISLNQLLVEILNAYVEAPPGRTAGSNAKERIVR